MELVDCNIEIASGSLRLLGAELFGKSTRHVSSSHYQTNCYSPLDASTGSASQSLEENRCGQMVDRINSTGRIRDYSEWERM